MLEEIDTARTSLTALSLVDSFEARDALVAHGMEQGIVESYERSRRGTS